MSVSEPRRRSRGSTATIAPRAYELVGSFHRRAVAALIDAAIVAGTTFGIAMTQLETTLAASPAAGDGAVSADAGGWLRFAGWTLGGSGGDSLIVTSPGGRHVLAGLPLGITIGACALVALLTLVLIPANTGGATPGKRVVGLRVLTDGGNAVGLSGHLLRATLGLVDLAPWVVPGLLGLLTASRSPTRQRLGDRLAGTKVVDRRHPDRPPAPVGEPMRRRRPAPSEKTDSPSEREKAEARSIGEVLPPEPSSRRAPQQQSAGQGENLVWSEEHEAWMYRDRTSGRWLRHDAEVDRWVLVD